MYLVDAAGVRAAIDGSAANIFNFVSSATTNPKTNAWTTVNPGDLLLAFLTSSAGGVTAGQAGWADIISASAFRAVQYFIPGTAGTFQPEKL